MDYPTPPLAPPPIASTSTSPSTSPSYSFAAKSPLGPEITPSETYQLDSDEFESNPDMDDFDEDEYDKLVDEAESAFSEEEVKGMTAELKEGGLVNFLRSYLEKHPEEGSLRRLLLAVGVIPPVHLRHPSTPNILLLQYTKLALSRILRRREKLPQYNTPQDAIDLLRTSKNIVILSGAGISTSCGIPDFRSAGGLYAQLREEGGDRGWDLEDPQQMFDISYFRERPEVFYSFAKQIYPSRFVPSACHRWIKSLEDRGVLLRNYTQNIDTLESLAGVTKVLQCHGSFATASCLRCKTRVPGATIEPYIMSQQIPYCGSCRQQRDAELEAIKQYKAARRKGKSKKNEWEDSDEDDEEEDEWGGGEPGIIKPDITFFGQALDSKFDECLFEDREKVDLLVIIGTSLKVAPVSEVLTHIPHSVPQIFINLTPVTHVHPDICLLGDADTIVTYLSSKLDWSIPPPSAVVHSPKSETKHPVEEDTVKPISCVKVPPEEVVWMSGVGEMAHWHVLTSKEEIKLEEESRIRLNGMLRTAEWDDEDEDEDEEDERGESGESGEGDEGGGSEEVEEEGEVGVEEGLEHVELPDGNGNGDGDGDGHGDEDEDKGGDGEGAEPVSLLVQSPGAPVSEVTSGKEDVDGDVDGDGEMEEDRPFKRTRMDI